MKTFLRWFGLALCVAMAGCGKKTESTTDVTVRPAAKVSDEILIGEYGSMTGSTATFGIGTHKGIMIAVDEINDKGGILGKKVKILLEDDQGDAKQANNAVLKLIKRDHVVAILGEVASSCSRAAAPIARRTRFPCFRPRPRTSR